MFLYNHWSFYQVKHSPIVVCQKLQVMASFVEWMTKTLHNIRSTRSKDRNSKQDEQNNETGYCTFNDWEWYFFSNISSQWCKWYKFPGWLQGLSSPTINLLLYSTNAIICVYKMFLITVHWRIMITHFKESILLWA